MAQGESGFICPIPGALVEAGGPDFAFALGHKDHVWAAEVGRLYQQAVSNQWDPATAVPWEAPVELSDAVEDAVVQVMTYLVENETAALIVPARFAGRVHPHFREVMKLLAVQTADEARHIEVFTRRALLHRTAPGSSTVGGQTSLKTLLDEPDFALASFLLSVPGEGTFLHLLLFLSQLEVDPITTAVRRLAAADEARHVALGVAHLKRHVSRDPGSWVSWPSQSSAAMPRWRKPPGSTWRCSTRSCLWQAANLSLLRCVEATRR